jgi:hypothetical protein
VQETRGAALILPSTEKQPDFSSAELNDLTRQPVIALCKSLFSAILAEELLLVE